MAVTTLMLAVLAAAILVAASVYALMPKVNTGRYLPSRRQDVFGGGWFGYWNRLAIHGGSTFSVGSKAPGLLALGSAAAAAAAVALFFVWAAPLGAVAAPLSLRYYWNRKAFRRTRTVGEQLPEFLFALAAAVRRGLTLEAALTEVSRHCDNPLRQDLDEAINEIALGVPLPKALAHWSAISSNSSIDIVAANLSIAHASGGVSDLGEDLTDLGKHIAEENALTKTIYAKQSQLRLVKRIALVMGPAGLALTYLAFGAGALPGMWAVLGPAITVVTTVGGWFLLDMLGRSQFANAGEVQ